MQGTITKHSRKDGKISWGYYFRGGRQENGKWKQVTKSGFKSKREAQDDLRIGLAQHAAGAVAVRDPRTFSEFFDYWMKEYAGHRCSPKTIEAYGQQGAYAKRCFGDVAIYALQSMRIEQSINQLRARGGKNGRPLSVKTVRHIAFVINASLETAVRWGLLQTNPMKRVELPEAEKKEASALDKDSLGRIFAGAKGTRLYPLLVVAAATGCRRGELLALLWTDIDFESGVLTVNKSLEQTKAGLRVKSTKSKKSRKFAIPQFALDVLRGHQATQNHDKELFGNDYDDRGYVFCPPEGGRYCPDRVTGRVSEFLRDLGFPKGVSLHTLRHSHASELLSKGTPLPTVSKRLGHSSPTVTLQIYSHALEADEVAAAKIWNDAMSDVIEENRPSKSQMLGNARNSAKLAG